MDGEIDTFNKFVVGRRIGGDLVILNPPAAGDLANEDALLLAAYLVKIADPLGEQFPKVLEAVRNA
jgi:hypothetical protein